MRKRISTRAICLLLSAVILAGALTVSAINGSPYENLKNAVFNALFYENVTAEGEVVLRIDGHEHVRAWFIDYIDYIGDGNRLSRGGTRWCPQHFDVTSMMMGFELEYESFETQGLVFDTVSGTTPLLELDRQWYRARRNHSPSSNSTLGYEFFGTAGRNSNQVRLVELFIDLLVGDLRNNLTISTGEGVRRVSGAITESQLPEIARVAIAIAIDEQLRFRDQNLAGYTREDFEHLLEIPVTSVAINRISGDADIDGDGNLLYISARAHVTVENIFGDSHEIEVEGYLRFSDIGTTVPESSLPCVEFLLELFEAFEPDGLSWDGSWWSFYGEDEMIWGWGRRSFYFTLDSSGNIDLDSIGFRPGVQDEDLREVLDYLLRNRHVSDGQGS